MKTITFIIVILSFILMIGCTHQNKQLSSDDFKTKITDLYNVKYLVASYKIYINNEVTNLTLSPQWVTKIQNTNKGTIIDTTFGSNLLTSLNEEPYELITDNTSKMLYLSTGSSWYKSPLTTDYSSQNKINFTTDISNILEKCFTDFSGFSFIGTETINGETVQHYQVKLDIYQALQSIYKDMNPDNLLDFQFFIVNENLESYVNLLKQFPVDFYLSNNQILQVDINLTDIETYFLDTYGKIDALLPRFLNRDELKNLFESSKLEIDFSDVNANKSIEINGDAQNGTITSIDELESLIPAINIGDNSGDTEGKAEAPLITLNGPKQITIDEDEPFTDPGVVAFDNKDGFITNVQTNGTVDTSTPGTYTITYKVYDSSRLSAQVSRTVIVKSIPITNYTSIINLPISYTSVLMDPNTPVVYLLDSSSKSLTAYNLQTSATQTISFTDKPEHMVYANGKIYVTLLTKDHSNFWFTEDQTGAYAVVNPVLMTDVVYNIKLDPYGITVDNNGNIYITSGSGQISILNVYSPTGDLLTSSQIDEQTLISYNSNVNAIYALITDASPRSMYEYAFDSNTKQLNQLVYRFDMFLGNSNLPINQYLSPDGKYLFYRSGIVYSCNSNSDLNLLYTAKINQFSDIAFNLSHNEFYLLLNNYIYVYNYSDFTLKFKIKLDSDATDLFYQNNQLYVLGQSDSPFVKVYSVQ